MDSTIAKLVFELAGSGANVLNNMVGHSISIDKNGVKVAEQMVHLI